MKPTEESPSGAAEQTNAVESSPVKIVPILLPPQVTFERFTLRGFIATLHSCTYLVEYYYSLRAHGSILDRVAFDSGPLALLARVERASRLGGLRTGTPDSCTYLVEYYYSPLK